MRLLAMETSCDETAIALLKAEEPHFYIEKNLIASQIKTHAQYGGVVPEIAAREHMKALFPLLEVLKIPRDGKGIDVLAVTAGPGLVVALRVGVEAAKALAYFWQKPLVAVNHLEGHIYSTFLSEETDHPIFPSLCLLVSGGHTELILMKGHGIYELLGMTRDDAAGEAFDKVAKMLGLEYPGGIKVSQKAEQGNPKAIEFPRPMLDQDNLDFSFSGLKTAVLLYLKKHPVKTEKELFDICASFQAAVVDTLVIKTFRAAQIYKPKSVLLAGGVSANETLRRELKQRLSGLENIKCHFAPLAFTTDNAAMIAAAGYFHARQNDFINPLGLIANPNLSLM